MKNRNLSIDLLRIVATIGVISIHSDQITERLNYFGGISWWFSNIIHSFSSVSVPIFFMISGYLLINPKEIKNNSAKTIKRVLLPLILWTIVYLPWKYKWHGEIPKVVTLLFGSYHHLYFLSILAVLYLLKPKIEKFIQKNNDRLGKYIIYAFIISSMISAFYYFVLNNNPTNNALIVSPTYISFFMLGHWIKSRNIKNKLYLILCFYLPTCISIASYLSYKSEIVGNSIFILESGANYSWEAFNPLVILSSFFIFISFLSFFKKKSGWFIINLSLLTYGIYLIHPMIIDLVDHYFNFAIHLATENLWLHYTKKIIIVFLLSIISTFTLKKIRLGKILFGES